VFDAVAVWRLSQSQPDTWCLATLTSSVLAPLCRRDTDTEKFYWFTSLVRWFGRTPFGPLTLLVAHWTL